MTTEHFELVAGDPFAFTADSAARMTAEVRGHTLYVDVEGSLFERHWKQLKAAVEVTARVYQVYALSLTIDSMAQQAAGACDALETLEAARRRLITFAHIRNAGGLAVLLARLCDTRTATATARIGHLAFTPSINTSEAWVAAHRETAWLRSAIRGGRRGLMWRWVDQLRHRAELGEQLERRGLVQALTSNPETILNAMIQGVEN
ncbi:hypothetical protein [Aeoliella sp.]|uniref:hypothetical protein n=1 Tax=Aeoliella sp. TaxID=2795800 RepID=UPI003CCC3B82